MRKQSKRYRADLTQVDAKRSYPLEEAIAILKKFKPLKFDASVEMALKLNVDPKKSEQNIRGSVALPKGIGKSRKVIVFVDGEEARQAKELGAEVVGLEDLAEKIQGGWADFDVAIAHPRAMKVVGKLGKILGPQGKMPTPKSGTVTQDIATAVREFKAGKIEFRNDPAGNVQVAVGRVSFSEADLRINVEAFLEHIKGLRPSSVRGPFIQRAFLSATMSPSVSLAVSGM